MTQPPSTHRDAADFVWTLAVACQLHRVPQGVDLARSKCPQLGDRKHLLQATAALGMPARRRGARPQTLKQLAAPCFLPGALTGVVTAPNAAPSAGRVPRGNASLAVTDTDETWLICDSSSTLPQSFEAEAVASCACEVALRCNSGIGIADSNRPLETKIVIGNR